MPDPLCLAAALIIGFALGLFPAILLTRSRIEAARESGRRELAPDLAALDERLSGRDEQLRRQEAELQHLSGKIDRLIQENTALESAKSTLTSQLKEEARHSEEKLQVLNDAKKELQTQFENIANQIFEEKTKTFAAQSRANLDTILTPFKEKITAFENKVTEVYTNEGKERHSLIREVQRLQELNLKIGVDAENLTKALKGDTKTQGTWGEIILERILEESGLRKGIEYDSQGGFRDTDGKLLKPDVIVHLPEGKEIIIDSKVSLIAYEKYFKAENDIEKNQLLKDHLLSINAHLRGLESKKYDELPGVKSLDFVLMFIPIESAFMLAIEKDNEIFRKAFDQNIMIVSPSTLLVTLRTIENIWRYEYQNKNALKIADEAGKLYDKFVGFVEDLEKVGRQLDVTKISYDAAHNKLKSGRGNLISKAKGLIDLGVKSRKHLSEKLVEEAKIDTLLVEKQGNEESRASAVTGKKITTKRFS